MHRIVFFKNYYKQDQHNECRLLHSADSTITIHLIAYGAEVSIKHVLA